MEKPTVLAIVGPTATGKTDAAVVISKALGGEVVCMDSMQIYEHLRIGTAAPSQAEMQGIPHHMFACVAPDAAYSVADYQQDADAVLQGILKRGHLPVFTGGTGLYLQAISHPMQFTQASNTSAVRAALEMVATETNGKQRLHDQLRAVDPVSADRLHVNDVRRVIRALEVCEVTGIPFSQQQKDWDAQSPYAWILLGITWPREQLYARIEHRVDAMIEAGLVDEVSALLRSGVPMQSQAMQAIGYKEVVAYLQGEISLDTAIMMIKMHTRRYAKRQMTWFRRNTDIQWFDATQYSGSQALYAAMLAAAKKSMEATHAGNT